MGELREVLKTKGPVASYALPAPGIYRRDRPSQRDLEPGVTVGHLQTSRNQCRAFAADHSWELQSE